MKNNKLYKDTFSKVHTGLKMDMEVYKDMKPTNRIKKRMVVLAAVVCLLLAVSFTAYATNLFGLKDLVLKSGSGEVIEASYINDLEVDVPVEMISLQGYSNSNEYKAVAEWTAFCKSYDQDGKLLAQVGNGPTGLDERYSLYLVYTQEMADKLDEIVSKYGLALHQLWQELNVDELSSRSGPGKILGAANTPYGGYKYEDGTFHLEGNVLLESGQPIDYQLVNCAKGSFTDILLNIGDADTYNEWTYTTSNGVTVSLSTSPQKCLVFADLGNSFVTINVLAGTDESSGKITASDLEAFVNAFDFSVLK